MVVGGGIEELFRGVVVGFGEGPVKCKVDLEERGGEIDGGGRWNKGAGEGIV